MQQCYSSFPGELDILNFYDMGEEIGYFGVCCVTVIYILKRLRQIRNIKISISQQIEKQVLNRKAFIHFLLLLFNLTIMIAIISDVATYIYISKNQNIISLNTLVNNSIIKIWSQVAVLLKYLYNTILTLVYSFISYIYTESLLFFQQNLSVTEEELEKQRIRTTRFFKIIAIILCIIYLIGYIAYFPLILVNQIQVYNEDLIAKINFFLTLLNTVILMVLACCFYSIILRIVNLSKKIKRLEIIKILMLMISLLGRILVAFLNTSYYSFYFCRLRAFSTDAAPFKDQNHTYFIYLLIQNLFMILIPCWVILKLFAPTYDLSEPLVNETEIILIRRNKYSQNQQRILQSDH